jgi:5-methylthioadenosine/S-adenosylhomocysteine deaminase
MWEEIRLAALIHKGVSEDPTKMPAETVLKMATSLGAAGLHLDDKIGVLKSGMRADMIQISLKAPHLTPLYNVTSHLVYAAGAEDVVTTIIEGVVLMKDRNMTQMDEEAILSAARAKAAEIAEALANR